MPPTKSSTWSASAADKDLPFDISCDFELDFTAAERIGAEIVRKRYANSAHFARMSTDEIVAMIRELNARAKTLPENADFWEDHDAYMRLRGAYFPR